MADLKNESLRVIYVGDSMIMPGKVAEDLPDDVLSHSGVKSLFASRDLVDVSAKPRPQADSSEDDPPPQPARPAQPRQAAPPPPASKG